MIELLKDFLNFVGSRMSLAAGFVVGPGVSVAGEHHPDSEGARWWMSGERSAR
jgi:hypothetical protein